MAARKNTTPAQIINRLRKAEVELANGKGHLRVLVEEPTTRDELRVLVR